MDDAFHSSRYLIIDDFEQMRVSFKSMLVSSGASNISLKSSGEEALKALSREKFDVVICDYNLGEGKDGQQVLEEARHLGYLGHACTFCMITAESNMPMVLGALEHQPDEYMVKPINREVLLHRLSGALQRKQQIAIIDDALEQGDKAKAIALCRESRGGDLKRSLYLAKLQGELCLDLGRLDEAMKVYQDLLRIRPFPWALFGVGKIAFLQGDQKQAKQVFEKLICQNQHYLEAYDWLVKVLENEGDTPGAKELLTQATKLSSKSVKRQRTLGRLAKQAGDITVAERAYQAAVRWGRNSCFASADEYRQLASLYRDQGQKTKMLRLLADGRKRFCNRPGDRIQMLCSNALLKRQLDQNSEIESDMKEVERMLEAHRHELLDEHLLTVADECYSLSRSQMAESILRIVLSNHHDETVWIDRVRALMQSHQRSEEAERLIRSVQGELDEIQRRSTDLLRQGVTHKALSLLNDTIDLFPGNRTLVLLSVDAMIEHMNDHGLEQSYHFRCRHSLANLLQRDQHDEKASQYLGRLTQILN